MPSLPSVAVAELPDPSVETPLKKMFCVEYARMRSGLAMFGDAKFWWARAKNLYARAKAPVENAVMVFTVTPRLKLGHVAVVTKIVSSREIRVDQANWQNHGEIDHSTPVLDVSTKNDWSQVRVWDIKSSQFGRMSMPVSGLFRQGPGPPGGQRIGRGIQLQSLPLCGLRISAGSAKPGLAATGAAFLSALGFFFSRLFFCSRLAMAALPVAISEPKISKNRKNKKPFS